MTNHQHTGPSTTIPAAGEHPGNALTVAERAFLLLTTGPMPLAINGRAVGNGLPARLVDLAELRTLLLERTASDDLKDAAWSELVRQARMGDPAWVVGCVGVAMPGLKTTAARAIRSSPARYADDIVSEMLTEFVAQLARIDIERPHILERLMLWARKGALRARGREARHVPCDPNQLPDRIAVSDVDSVNLLLDAARQGIITPTAAELIIATRLDAASVQDIARRQQTPVRRLYRQRQIAEAHIAAAIGDGRISSAFADRT